MRVRLRERERPWLVLLLLFALVLLRFCYYGFAYFPQLDDYIQMHNQSAYYSARQVILDMGLLSSRPLASVGDYFVWSRFWPHLMAPVALLAGLYAGSACLFRQVWRQYFGTGYVFLVLYALFPLGMEGTYWLSASSRVVPAVFLTALAMWLFQRWCRDGRRAALALYFVTQLLSFCFYEQGLVLSVTGVLLVGILEFRARRGRALWSLLTFLNVVLYFAFTGVFATTGGQLGSRLRLALPWQEGWGELFDSAFQQVKSAFTLGGTKTLFRGFRRGLECLFADFHWLWLLMVLALCALLFLAARRWGEERAEAGSRLAAPWALAVGFLMALAPVTIFFVLANPFFSLRNTVFSFCGLALMADALWTLVLRRVPRFRTVTAGLCALAALVFCVCAVSELHDYRDTYLADQRAAVAVVSALDGGAGFPAGTKVGVLNLRSDYLPEQNFKFHEHIHGATESAWAFTGLLAAVSGNPGFPYTTPLPVPPEDLSGYDVLLVYDHASGTAEFVKSEE